MNKKGKYYVPLVSGFMIVLLLGAYFMLSSLYSQNEDSRLTNNIGSKQAGVVAALLEGERVIAYVQHAALLVPLQASVANPCGEPYLNLKILGRGDCSDSVVVSFQRELGAYLASYPSGPLTDMTWKEHKENDGTVMLEGTKLVPIGITAEAREQQPGAPLVGPVTGWPTDLVEGFTQGSKIMRINHEFGNRDVVISGKKPASRNHPGLDIRTKPDNDHSGQDRPVYALTAGKATFIKAATYEQDSWVQITTGDATFKYMHVYAAQNIPDYPATVAVQPGTLIAYTREHPGGPHLHLGVEVNSFTSKEARTLWPRNAANSKTHTAGRSYAVLTDDNAPAALDPICFFARESATQALRDSNQLKDNSFEACDAYAKVDKIRAAIQSITAQATAPKEAAPVAQPANTTFTFTIKDNKERFEETQQNVAPYMQTIQEAAADEEIDPKMLLAIITQESQGNPDAISPTGAAGIAQFVYPTAKDFYPKYFKKLTPCGSNKACTPSNDDRFDPVISIKVQAKHFKYLYDLFDGYDHRAAFAFAAYNGGPCPVLEAIKKTGKENPTWLEVNATLGAFPDKIQCGNSKGLTSIDKKQISDYTDRVLEQYQAWGGATFAQTQFTADTIGYYEVNVKIPGVKPSVFDAPIREMQAKIERCDSQYCIEQAIASTVSNSGLSITPEPLDAIQGCLAPADRAQAYVANQIATCQQSPMTNCSCAFKTGVNAEFSVTAGSTLITKLGENTVTAEPTIGVGSADQIEGESASVLQFYVKGIPVIQGEEKGVLQIKDNKAFVTETREGFFNPDTRHVFASFYKLPDALAFAPTNEYACITPPEPQAYCLRSSSNPEQKVVFFVDMQAHSTPVANIQSTASTPAVDTAYVRINFTSDNHLPYVHVTTRTGSSQPLSYYLRTQQSDLPQPFSETREAELLQAARDGHYEAARSGDEYVLYVPKADTYTLSLLDENLRETQAVPVLNTNPFDIFSIGNPLNPFGFSFP